MRYAPRCIVAIGLLLAGGMPAVAAPADDVGGGAAGPGPAPVGRLLEDNAEPLLKVLTNPTGDPGEGRVEQAVVFSGTASIKIIPMQRFHPTIAGWRYPVAEHPGPGEYRYLRFAWRADGCQGIMLQLHDEKDWNVRYVAGIDVPGWGSKAVAERPPEGWVVVTRDLYKDFGARTITGIALTAFGNPNEAGYFDHIYLGRTVDDLDRIDATGIRAGGPVRLTPDDLDRAWDDLSEPDAARSYRAFWTLAADPERSVPFLRGRLAPVAPGDAERQIREWIAALGDARPRVREAASEHLARRLTAAAPLLEAELRADVSPEVWTRITMLLRDRPKNPVPRPDPTEAAVRLLRFAATPEAKKCIQELADGAAGDRVADLAKAALEAEGPRPQD